MKDIPNSIDACAAHYGSDAEQMRDYLLQGEQTAKKLNNRGPIKFDDNGELSAEIRSAYSEYGFYIFEGLINAEELEDLMQDISQVRNRFPIAPDQTIDANGQPALGTDCKAPTVQWAKPLSDPLGGTDLYNGRHQVKLFEPEAAEDAPDFLPLVLMGQLQFSEACLRLYGHPQLLKVAEAVHGKDFAPFNEVIFFKDAGLGAAVSWHQDGDTHWDSPDFDEDIHGFNFMAQVHSSTAVNGVWVLPGSHRQGKIDIKSMMEEVGSERLPSAVPMICNPGDVVICNRQIVHGSFANTGYEPRLTVNFGFHRRSAVLDVLGAGMHSQSVVYDEAHIKKRSKAIALGIAARKEKYTSEAPFNYQPLANENIEWHQAGLAELKDYNLLDLSI